MGTDNATLVNKVVSVCFSHVRRHKAASTSRRTRTNSHYHLGVYTELTGIGLPVSSHPDDPADVRHKLAGLPGFDDDDGDVYDEDYQVKLLSLWFTRPISCAGWIIVSKICSA